MRFAIMLILGASAVSASAQTANTAREAPMPASVRDMSLKGDPQQIICRHEDVVGSRLGGRRVCRSRAEWADAQLENRFQIDKMQKLTLSAPLVGP